MVGKVARVAVLIAVLPGCGRGEAPVPAIGFDAGRAWADLVSQVQLGSRPAGSPAAARLRAWASGRLRQAGWVVEEHAFEAALPGGESMEMRNLIARLRAAAPAAREVMLIAHYDTKHLPGFPAFRGANDGASGVALLLEVARQLARRERAFDYTLVLFDGEEARGPQIDSSDGLYGSRALAQRMAGDGALERVRALLLVDMLADADLNISHDRASDPELVRLWQRAAEAAGKTGLLAGPIGLVDDHTPFARAGLTRYLALIDFQYGERRSPGWRWHSDGDTLAGVSRESLGAAGTLVMEWLQLLEAEAPDLALGGDEK